MEQTFKNFVQFITEADIRDNPAITPEYFASLNKRTEAAVRRIEQKHGPEMARFMQLVIAAQSMQRGKERDLESLAEAVILDEFGYILGNTKLDIKFSDPIEMSSMMKQPKQPKQEEKEEEKPPMQKIEDEDTRTAIHKRKILNMITQGEALNAKKLFTGEVAVDGLNKIFGEQDSKKFIDLLVKITDIATAMDWRIPEDVAAEMWEQGTGFSGVSKVEWKPSKKDVEGGMGDEDEDDESEPEQAERSDEATVIARGLDFSMLIHEAIKGIYSLISQGGLAHLDDETIQKVLMNTDTMEDEIQDLKRGKLTAADLRDFLNTFPELGSITNGRQYVYGKMIDANVVSDKDFLELMRLIFVSAPLYKSSEEVGIEYTDQERSVAEEAFPKAKKKVQALIDAIKQELADWEESQRPRSVYDEDDDEEGTTIPGEETETPWLNEPTEERPMSRSEIQDLIDKALDRRDFAEVARLSQLQVNEEAKNDEP
jgi:hypothetical protein